MLARVQAKWPEKVTLLRVLDHCCDGDCPIVKDDLWLYSNRRHLNKAGLPYMPRGCVSPVDGGAAMTSRVFRREPDACRNFKPVLYQPGR